MFVFLNRQITIIYYSTAIMKTFLSIIVYPSNEENTYIVNISNFWLFSISNYTHLLDGYTYYISGKR